MKKKIHFNTRENCQKTILNLWGEKPLQDESDSNKMLHYLLEQYFYAEHHHCKGQTYVVERAGSQTDPD